MARRQLTDRSIRNLKTEKTQEDFYDKGFSDGSFAVRVTTSGRKSFVLFYRANGRKRRMTLGTYPAMSLAEARKKARDVLNEVFKGHDPAKQRLELRAQPTPTLEGYYGEFDKVFVSNPGAIRNSTRDHYRWAFETHILRTGLGKMRLDEIGKPDIEGYVADLVERGYAKGTIEGIVKSLRKVFNWAVEHEIISKSPVKKLGQLYSQAPVRSAEIDPYSQDEAVLFLATALGLYPDDHYFLFLTAIHTGLREGELKALKWTDMDFENKRIHVRRNYSHGQMNPPKTTRGKRGVDMSDFLLSELKRWKTKLKKYWLTKGQNDIPDWVFPNRVGNMTDTHNLKNRQFKKIIQKAGLRSIPFHSLRDSFATLLLMANTPLSYISEQLGHRDPRVTVEHYAKWLPGSNRKAMNVLPSPEVHEPSSKASLLKHR